MKRNKTFIFIVASLTFLIILGITTTIDLYANWLFFNELNYTGVFTKILSTKIILGLLCGFLSLAFLLVNIIIANKTNFPPIDLLFMEQTTVSLNIELLNKWAKPLTIISGIIIGFLGGIWGSSLWEKVLLFQNYANVDLNDPIFSKDIGFYLFKLPLFESVKGFAGFIIIATLLIVSINYFLRGGIASRERNVFIDKRVKKHIGILAGLFILNIATGFYLDRFDLLLSSHGVIFGA
ncbi:MAG: UPF0182 family protein, partial [Thermodesulfovibrionales bacterium]|nr:UPF0182 family protein [Thermodesulfovibrionales bacterium]